jgi:hypothetical protein
MRAKINEIETKKIYKESTKQIPSYLKKNKIDKPLANLTKMRGQKTQINEIRYEKEVLVSKKQQGNAQNHHRLH